jgi:hypothetical protein
MQRDQACCRQVAVRPVLATRSSRVYRRRDVALLLVRCRGSALWFRIQDAYKSRLPSAANCWTPLHSTLETKRPYAARGTGEAPCRRWVRLYFHGQFKSLSPLQSTPGNSTSCRGFLLLYLRAPAQVPSECRWARLLAAEPEMALTRVVLDLRQIRRASTRTVRSGCTVHSGAWDHSQGPVAKGASPRFDPGGPWEAPEGGDGVGTGRAVQDGPEAGSYDLPRVPINARVSPQVR